MLNPDFQPCPPFQSAVTEELIKCVCMARAEISDSKKMVKILKRTINSSKIYTSCPRVGLDGDVDGVDGKMLSVVNLHGSLLFMNDICVPDSATNFSHGSGNYIFREP